MKLISTEPLKLFNTLTKKKEIFKPLQKNQVSFYACGVTVYDYCHIGHARAYVAFDCVKRALLLFGYQVKHIQNFTDIDDKIIKRCLEQDEPLSSLTSRYISAYHKDMAALQILPADYYPKATESLLDIISMIQTLMDKGAAYFSEGDVYFNIQKAPQYGRLSRKVLEELQAGARVEKSTRKQHDLDFVLWKAAKEGEPSWESPWGLGRPGWHIECSAMVKAHLGDAIDIHAGGEDLIFPHHENEIAQSCCANDCDLARFWLHNGFVNLNNQKMSKSTQNTINLQDCIQEFGGTVLRFYLLKTHYRHPLSFSKEGLIEAKQAYSRLLKTAFHEEIQDDVTPQAKELISSLVARFQSSLADDVNTAAAIGFLFDLAKRCHQFKCARRLFRECGELLGLFSQAPTKQDIQPNIAKLIEERLQAKKNKNYALADQIRQHLIDDHGIHLRDTRDGSEIVT